MFGFLSRRKQAYTGKPASAMYYCEEKKRYVIEGESSSDDEPPPPPPKMTQKPKTPVVEEKKEEEKSGVGSLLAAPTNPNLNRGRGSKGRGRGRGGPRFASTFDQSQVTDNTFTPPPSVPEEEKKFEDAPSEIKKTEVVEESKEEPEPIVEENTNQASIINDQSYITAHDQTVNQT